MPNMENNEQMQERVGELLAYLSENMAGTVQGASVPRLAACDHEARTLELVFDTAAWMRNPAGMLHGGMTAMMLDTTMGVLSFCYAGGNVTPTVTMSVSYLRPIPAGAQLHILARADRPGRTINYISAQAWVEDADRPAATATGAFFAAPAEPLGK